MTYEGVSYEYMYSVRCRDAPAPGRRMPWNELEYCSVELKPNLPMGDEDGLLSTDRQSRLSCALALWNGRYPILRDGCSV